MKKSKIILFTAFFLVISSSLALTNDSFNQAHSLLAEGISLLNKTGGIGSFDVIPGAPPPNEYVLDPSQVKEIVDEAIQKFKMALRADPNIKEAHYFLAIAYVRKVDRENAISELLNSIEVEPDRKVAYVLLCELLWDVDRYEQALTIVTKYMNRFPDDKITRYFLEGQTYFWMSDFHNALDAGLNMLKEDNSRLEGHYLVGFSSYCLGDYKVADEQFRFLETDPRVKDSIKKTKEELTQRCGTPK